LFEGGLGFTGEGIGDGIGVGIGVVPVILIMRSVPLYVFIIVGAGVLEIEERLNCSFDRLSCPQF
jgi:hypothetical protein